MICCCAGKTLNVGRHWTSSTLKVFDRYAMVILRKRIMVRVLARTRTSLKAFLNTRFKESLHSEGSMMFQVAAGLFLNLSAHTFGITSAPLAWPVKRSHTMRSL